MAVAHSLGFPRIGRDRELKKAQEAFWKGELNEAGLRAVGRELRKAHWDLQKNAGIELLRYRDFSAVFVGNDHQLIGLKTRNSF